MFNKKTSCEYVLFHFRSKKLDPQPQITRVFGMDLNDLVVSTSKEVPDVLVQCTTFIEKHGLVDGVYRISGISSNIKRLKYGSMIEISYLSI